MVAGGGSAEETAGFTIGQPHEIPDLVAGHIEAGADEVIFSFAFADAPVSSPWRGLGLSGPRRHEGRGSGRRRPRADRSRPRPTRTVAKLIEAGT